MNYWTTSFASEGISSFNISNASEISYSSKKANANKCCNIKLNCLLLSYLVTSPYDWIFHHSDYPKWKKHPLFSTLGNTWLDALIDANSKSVKMIEGCKIRSFSTAKSINSSNKFL